MPQNHNITRRQLLKKATAAAVGTIGFPYIIRSSALGKAGTVAPSNRITMGCIGVGHHGGWGKREGVGNMGIFVRHTDVQMVAVCDVKQPRLDYAQQKVDNYYGGKVCAAYTDFRQLLARDDIDAVCIASPDHWHVLQALAAARAGKDMYVEKALAQCMNQRKVLRETIQRHNTVFQFGTQQRSGRSFRFGCELVLNGRIGKLHTIKVGAPPSEPSKNYPPMPVPDSLDYDMWLGPAPWAPYTENRVLRDHWFHISDYTIGFLANWGIHHIDIAQWGNGTQFTGPIEVEGTGTFPREGLCDCATGWNVNLKYANGVRLSFTDTTTNKMGVVFEGTEGWVYVKRWSIDAHPKSLLREKIAPDEIHLPVSNHHQKHFVDCVKTRRTPIAPVEAAVRSDTICHISDIAIRLKRKLRWDPDRECFINDDQANRMLSRPLRSPWHI